MSAIDHFLAHLGHELQALDEAGLRKHERVITGPQGATVRIADGQAATPGSIGEYNWGGAGGTAFWVDPDQDMFVVFMMQSPKMRLVYRSVIRNMVYAAITE